MEKAFDTILQSDVYATVAAKTGSFEPYRYECLCCGEEVYIAAAYSRDRIPHFKHRRGNNDTECEKYLGQLGAISKYIQIRRKKQDQVDFYFNRSQMTFEVGFLLSQEEIEECENRNEIIYIKDKYNSSPFYSVPISRRTFLGGERFFVPLSIYSSNYSVVLPVKNYVRVYQDVFAAGNKLNFYKVSGQDEQYRARRTVAKVVYTGTRYFVVSVDEKYIDELERLKNCVEVEDRIAFKTMDHNFYGLTLRFVNKDYLVSRLLSDSDYQLEYDEKATVLWPPMIPVNDQLICESDKVYIQTSFELQPHGNINCDKYCINDIGNGLYKLQVDGDIKIYRKNAELTIKRTKIPELDKENTTPYDIYTDKFEVPEKGEYFLFNSRGCSQLMPHQNVYLSSGDHITHYENHYICGRIYGKKEEPLSVEDQIQEMKMFWKQIEPYSEDLFSDRNLSIAVQNYLDECKALGTINSLVKRYIEEGRL